MRKQETGEGLQWAMDLEMSSERNFHLSKQHLGGSIRKTSQDVCVKPTGLWYAPGSEWREWTRAEMPTLLAKYNVLYDVEITDRVLRISTPEDVHEFSEWYRAKSGWEYEMENVTHGRSRITNIDWLKVAQDWSGVEVNPYHWDLRFTYLWYSGLDVPSGCIWDPAGASVRLVGTREDFNEEEAPWGTITA